MQFDILPLFSSPLTLTKLNQDTDSILEQLKETEYIDTLDSTNQQSNIQSKISKSKNILEFFPALQKEIVEHLSSYIKDVMRYEDLDFKITSSWSTLTPPGHSGESHCHKNSWLSGVFYPQDGSNILFSDGYQFFYHEPSEYNLWNSSKWAIPAEKNLLIFFPSHLNHQITSNTSSTNRHSIAFNVFPRGVWGEGDSINSTVS